MKTVRSALAGIATAAVLSTGAMATGAPPLPAGFDWAGPYLGVYGGRSANYDPLDWNIWFIGGQAGYNFSFGDGFLFGAEIAFGYSRDEGDNETEGAVTTRIGAVLGGRFVPYAEVGVWMEDNFNNYFLSIGGGVELSVGPTFSVFAEAAWLDRVGQDSPDFNRLLVRAGVNWHPGN